jgi:hypothetical protein
MSASYLDLHLEIDSEGRLRTKLYDKRDDFNFPIICRNIPTAPAYGVYISQLIRYSRTGGSYQDFLDRGLLLTRKLLNQGFSLVKLKSSLRKFYGRHHDLVDHYGISLSQMTTDMFHLSVLSSFMTFHRVCITTTRLTRRVPLVEQELLTLLEHLSSPPLFTGVSCYSIFSFMCMFCRLLFVLLYFLLAIVLSVLLWYTDSKLSLISSSLEYIWWTQISIRHQLLKSASTDVIISNHHLIYGYSKIGVLSKFSDLWPIYWYQIDVLFRAKISMCFYFVTWWKWVKIVHHLHSTLYQMNAKHQSCRNKFGVPDPCFVYITALSVYPSFNSLRNFFGPQLGFILLPLLLDQCSAYPHTMFLHLGLCRLLFSIFS